MPSTPALFETTVRPFTPESRKARVSASGMPESPKPPAWMIMPSFRIPASADLASAYTFFMRSRLFLEIGGLIAEHAENGQFFRRRPREARPSYQPDADQQRV